jgi:hypothetical protein
VLEKQEKQENRNKCADISLEISAIRCEISAEIWEKMWNMCRYFLGNKCDKMWNKARKW